MRSATAPETILIAVATNTTWKKKSEGAAYVASLQLLQLPLA